MYLFRCECGCFFTVKTLFAKEWRSCPNCGKKIVLHEAQDAQEIRTVLEKAGVRMSLIPDAADVEVRFKV